MGPDTSSYSNYHFFFSRKNLMSAHGMNISLSTKEISALSAKLSHYLHNTQIDISCYPINILCF